MIDMRDVWDVYEGATFRIHHNYEACYWWYRKDWFDAKGVQVPTTWDEVAQMGAVFTDEASDVWATEDGLTSGGFLNVYLAWITLQAGGNPFDADDKYRTALEYIKSLMDNKTLNPASLQKSYDQQNADYQADKVAFMRQWRYFYDLAHGNTDWYADGKAEIGLPPAGPVGKPLTYVAGWGWGIPTTTLSVMAALLASYAFARIAVPGRNILLWLFILSMSLPDIVTVIPLYRLLANMGLLDSLVGLTLIMSSVLVPFTVWVLIAFIQQGPYDIEEAAIIDGANLFKIFRYIMIPLTSPALATMFVINFINSWNNLLYPLAFSGSPKSKTLSVAITEIYQARAPWGRPWNLVSTLGVVMVVPVIILVMFSQKAIVRGLTRGAIK
jgi:ABC-type glycerol-3-phosphate transport system permease component